MSMFLLQIKSNPISDPNYNQLIVQIIKNIKIIVKTVDNSMLEKRSRHANRLFLYASQLFGAN